MCGIVAYKGHKNCHPILLNGLKRLEYRGYDSAGIACINSNDKLVVTKRKGKVSELKSALSNSEIYNLGIAHTRWATHGKPNHCLLYTSTSPRDVEESRMPSSA